MSLQLSIAVAIVGATLIVWGAIAARQRWARRHAARRRTSALAEVAEYTRPRTPRPAEVTWEDDADRDRPLRGEVPPPPRRWWARRPRRAWF